MIDQAKQYYILFDPRNGSGKESWHRFVLMWQIKNSLNIQPRKVEMFYEVRLYLGKRKLNKVLKEIALLGYNDVWIKTRN